MQYGEAEYWDRRYQAEPVFFDWYLLYEQLAPVLTKYVRQEDRVLQVAGLLLLVTIAHHTISLVHHAMTKP